MQNKLRKTDHGNAWTIEGPIVAIIDIRHGPEMLQHSVWYQTLIVLANRISPGEQPLPQTTGSSTAPLPWSDRYIYAHTQLDENHTIIASWCQLCKYSCCRDPVSCLLPALSHRPVLRNISVVNVLLYSVSASLQIVLLKAAFGRQSSGGVVVRLFCLPYMIKKTIFHKKRTHSILIYCHSIVTSF